MQASGIGKALEADAIIFGFKPEPESILIVNGKDRCSLNFVLLVAVKAM